MSANSSEILSDLEIISNSDMSEIDDDMERVSTLEAKLVASNDDKNFLVLQEIREVYKNMKSMQKTTEEVMEENKNLIKMIDELVSENKKLKEKIEMEREDAKADQLKEVQHLKTRLEDAYHKENALLGSVRKMHREMDKLKSRAEKAEGKCAELSYALEEKKAADSETPTFFEEHKMKIEDMQNLVLSITKSCDQKDKIIAKFEKAAKKCNCSEENMEVPNNDSVAHLNGVWKFVMTSCPEDLYDEESRRMMERSSITHIVSETKHTATTVYKRQIIHQTRTEIGKKVNSFPDWTTRTVIRKGDLLTIDKYLEGTDYEVESRTESHVFDDFLRVRNKSEGIEKVSFFKRV